MHTDLSAVPVWLWICLVVVLSVQGLWVFNDARKRGMNCWLWGLFCLLNTPTNLFVYLIVSRAILGSVKCQACSARIRKKDAFCPYCGEEQK
jgi:hypothetical protein